MIRFALQKNLHTASGPMRLAVEMEVDSGEFVSLYGKSGSGKTTVLRMLAGLTDPDAGFIEVNGKVWFDSEKGVRLPPQKRKVGMVFQDYALFPHLTVRKNLEFALPGKSETDRVEEIMDVVGLRPFEHRRPETLSGGQKQRVALARALVGQPEVLLLDEPLSALDAEMRIQLQDEIAAAQKRFGVATLLVSHDLAEVFRLSQKVFCLDQGRIARSGKPDQVFLRERLSNKFRFTGVLLEKKLNDIVYVLTLLVGNDIVKVTSLPEDIEHLVPGDKLLVSSKAFNPIILKMNA